MEPLRAFDWNGRIVRYRERGEGAPMIFLHNGGSDHRIWDYQISRFAESHRVVAVDLPGFGASHRPDRPYDLDFYVEFLGDFIVANRWRRPILVGNCIGAAIVLEYAKTRPDEIPAIILFNVLGGRRMIRGASGINLPAIPATRIYLEWLGKIMARSSRLRNRITRGLFGKKSDLDREPIFQHLLEVSRRPEQVRSRWNLIRGLDSYGRFGTGFDRPRLPRTLLFWGRENWVMSERSGREFADWLGPEETVWVADAGHMAMVESPVLVNSKIAEFLGERVSGD